MRATRPKKCAPTSNGCTRTGEADKKKVQWTFFPPNARSRLIGLEQADKKKVQWTFFPPNARSRLIGLEQADKKAVRRIFPKTLNQAGQPAPSAHQKQLLCDAPGD